jgi:hypothetical protein
MTMRQSEYHNNTPEQVREYLQQAADITAELDVAPDLVGIAFSKAADLLSGKQIVLEQAGGILPMQGAHQH